MLDTLKAADFEPHVDTDVNIVIPGGANIVIKLVEVKENKNAMMPMASEETRIAFSLLFSGPLNSVFESGCYTVEQEKMGNIENVYICRIAPLSNEKAWYEIIFN